MKNLNLYLKLFIILLIKETNTLTPKEMLDIGKEAYIYAYPLVLMNVTKKVMGQRTPINQFFNVPIFPDDKFTDIVRPNVDTLYSTAWLDLSKCPIILSVPDTHDRYYLMQIMDAWTNVFVSIGKRTTGTKAKQFIIVGPDWKGDAPQNYEKIQAPTNTVWLLGRTQTNGKKDYGFVHNIQDGFKLITWKCSHDITEFNDSIEITESPAQYVDKMGTKIFFEVFAKALKGNKLPIQDKVIFDKMKQIGLNFDCNLDAFKLQANTIKNLNSAIKEAKKELLIKAKTSGKVVNGWRIFYNLGNYGKDYLKRALVALIGIGANLPQDAIYPTTFIDSEGNKLNGKNKYVIHFDKNNLPPVNAFWSITAYNSKSYLVANPINRYALGDRDELQFNKDGSLDIYIQHDQPDKEFESNWLPAPKDDFNLTMRLYWPKKSVIDGAWKPSAVKKYTSKT